MVLPQGEAHLLVVIVVGLVVGPVKPGDGLVHVVPGPCAGLVLAVTPLEDGEEEWLSPQHGRQARTLPSHPEG